MPLLMELTASARWHGYKDFAPTELEPIARK